jgi:Sec-independent protein translocase protein TatA
MDLGLGPYELVIIAVLALIFVGARELERAVDAVRRWWRNGR